MMLERRQFYFAGLGSAICGAVMTVISWAAPFPLQSDGSGGYIDRWNSSAMMAALILSFATCLLALFGRGKQRMVLLVVGLALLLLSFAALLANGV